MQTHSLSYSDSKIKVKNRQLTHKIELIQYLFLISSYMLEKWKCGKTSKKKHSFLHDIVFTQSTADMQIQNYI